ncbi:hypothetical protein VTN00DRAFT_9306 [Thermoascus crustaceus]|uniref:uncharacterized protein n=1 Tax=Thermoascus crustaceus TaxID=5088 RepID=UPI00374225EA
MLETDTYQSRAKAKNNNDDHDVDDPITVSELFHAAEHKLPKRSGTSTLLARTTSIDTPSARPSRCLFRGHQCHSLGPQVSPFPIGIAPSAMQKLVGGDGELDMERAAAKMGTTMILSTQSTTSLEDVIKAPGVEEGDDCPAPEFWFQIYISRNREKSASLIRRAEAAGYKAVALTVDTPILGNRINERKTPLVLPDHLSLANIEEPGTKRKVSKPTMNRILMNARTKEEAYKLSREASDTMNDANALLAMEHGANAIVASNHGGRQLDSVSSTIQALPEIVEAVRDRIPVILDGGIGRGSDVFKALALGADFTFIGRPALWDLSHSGQQGVERVLNILERELSRTMTLVGANKIGDIRRDMLGVEKGAVSVYLDYEDTD